MKVYLGLGSNINAQHHISQAKQVLLNTFEQVCFSKTYESQAVGFDGDNFFNLVAEIQVDEAMALSLLIEQLKKIEDDLGRVRGGAKFSSRHIDIDILLFGGLVCQHPIELPRGEIKQNAYVLMPLSELAGDLKEPGGELTYAELWQGFDKASQPLIVVTR